MNGLLFSLSSSINLVLFGMLALGIWYAGSRLTYLADAIAERFKLASSTMGLIFLALATSLPEVATTMTAAAKQNADLVLNNLFGGITLQTAILALADFWAKGAISNYPRKTNHALEATLLVALLACLQTAFVIGEPVSFFNIGMGSILVALVYINTIQLLRWYDDNFDWIPIDLPDIEDTGFAPKSRKAFGKHSSSALVLKGLVACVFILVLGIAIVSVSEVLATQTGLGSGFVGVTLLAAATSLPELSTTITAVRMGAYTLAISNVFGSNLIMIVLVFPADIFHTSGPILNSASGSTQLAMSMGILVTAVFLIGLIVRRKPKVWRIGADSMLVLALYASSLVLYYILK